MQGSHTSADNVSAFTPFLARIARRGGWGREGVRSEARAQQRLAPGGRSPHNPEVQSLQACFKYAGLFERHARHGGDFFQCGRPNAFDRAKASQQLAFALGADALDIIQR